MAVTSGFFNSVNHDRLYNAEQISSMFDGIILDGIYQGLGDAFIVKPYSELNCTVTVGTGRAWFDHTWTLNSTELALTLDDPNVLYDRIDAIVIDVDRRQDVRANSIKVVKGTVSEHGATKPSLIEEELHNQYPLAYVTVKAGSAAPIQAQYIENVIGQTKTPLVAGVLEHMDIGMFVQQMEAEFNEWFNRLKDTIDENTVADINNKLLELQDFDDSISNSIINPEGYAASKNVKISAKSIGEFCSIRGQKSFSVMLSDGYIFKLSSKRSTEYYDQSDYEHYYWYILTSSMYNTDQVVTATYDYTAQSVNASESGYIPTFSLLKANDSYPYTLYFAIGITSSKETAGGMWMSYRLKPACLKVTITSDHAVTYDISMGDYGTENVELDFWEHNPTNPSNDRSNYDYALVGSQKAAELTDGRFLAIAGGADNGSSGSRDCWVRPYIISSDGIVSNQGVYSRQGGPFIPTSSGHDTVRLMDCYQSTTDTSNVGVSVCCINFLSNSSTYNQTRYVYKIKLSDLTIDTSTVKDNYTGSPFYKPESINIKNNYYGIDDNGTYLYKRENSLTKYEKLKDIPPFIDFSTSLKGVQGISEYTAGLCSSDTKLIISGNGSEIRVGFAGDGTGFMSFSPLYSSSCLSSINLVNSLKLCKTTPQFVSSDGKTYLFLILGYISNDSVFPCFPSIYGNNKTKTKYNTYVLKIKIGD